MTPVPVVILGAGPAGLGAAYRLARRGGFAVTVVERQPFVGGNAGSFDLDGLAVDYGSHRLHPSCHPDILDDVRTLLGDDLLDRPRHGRIHLHQRWVHFPLKPVDLALHLPPSFGLGVARDAATKLARRSTPDTFAAVLERGLGRTICQDFYFPYARKIWGVDPGELDAEQARRRVASGSLSKMVRKVLKAVPGFRPKGAGRFFYPRQGFGQISEAYARAAVREGVHLRLNTSVSGIECAEGQVSSVVVQNGQSFEPLPARLVLSTIPVSAAIRTLNPAPPPEIQQAACKLRFRAMVLIYLVLETEQFTPFDAHYFPGADTAITRLSEPKNYGLALLPGRTVLCAELPCMVGDAHWKSSDAALGELVQKALDGVGLPVRVPVQQVVTRRLPQAYPIYTRDYREHFDQLDRYLSGIEGIVTFGRQGLFAHDNTHHALAMAYALERCVDDAGRLQADAWTANRRAFTQHVVED